MRPTWNTLSNETKRDDSVELSRWVSLLNVFPMGRMMGPFGVSGMSLSYHGAGGIGKLVGWGSIVELERVDCVRFGGEG